MTTRADVRVAALALIGSLLGSCRCASDRPKTASVGAPLPLPPNPVMLEAFQADTPRTTPEGSWWSHVRAQAPEIARAGITAVWLPPATKAWKPEDTGYAVYDRYDLGEFDQKGSVATRYGTLAELLAAIDALHAARVQVYGDVVMNHMVGADRPETFRVDGKEHTAWTRFDFPGRAGRYSTFTWNHDAFNGWQSSTSEWLQWHDWDFAPYAAGDAYDPLLGCEIRYADARQRAELVAWGKWLTAKLGLDGYRLDATKHILTSFVVEWLDAVKTDGRFAVSEAWFADLDALRAYARATGGKTSLFDVPLHRLFAAMSEGDGAFDMRRLAGAGLTGTDGDLAVSFVENYDTDDEHGALRMPVKRLKPNAYAYILTREKGYPSVFHRDMFEYGYGDAIRTLIAARAAHAYGPGVEYPEIDDEDLYAYARRGDGAHAGLVLLMTDGDARTVAIRTPFAKATLHDATGNEPDAVTTDADGNARLPLGARGYGVWAP